MEALDRLDARLAPERLIRLGHCPVAEDDQSGTLVLIGPDEPQFWPHFTKSAEYRDGDADPLDRWSQRVLTDIATESGGHARFPFGGPPYHPFFTWATRSGRFWPSPINFLVHDTAGLFVSFRGAVFLPGPTAAGSTGKNPCDTCKDRPCATACPVGAFAAGYDVDACKTHIATAAGADCMAQGCRARRACPVGQGNRLPAQAAFHMEAFL